MKKFNLINPNNCGGLSVAVEVGYRRGWLVGCRRSFVRDIFAFGGGGVWNSQFEAYSFPNDAASEHFLFVAQAHTDFSIDEYDYIPF